MFGMERFLVELLCVECGLSACGKEAMFGMFERVMGLSVCDTCLEIQQVARLLEERRKVFLNFCFLPRRWLYLILNSTIYIEFYVL